MARGRSAALHLAVDQALELATKALFPPLLASRHIGNTLQIDEGMELFDARNSALHPLFQAKA